MKVECCKTEEPKPPVSKPGDVVEAETSILRGNVKKGLFLVSTSWCASEQHVPTIFIHLETGKWYYHSDVVVTRIVSNAKVVCG